MSDLSSTDFSPERNIETYLGVIMTLLFFFCIIIIIYYAEPGFPWHSYITLTIGYYAAFGVMLLVPIDIACVVKLRTSTTSGVDSTYKYTTSTLSSAYATFFDIILVMGSAVLVFEEYYNTDGYFTVLSKMKSAFKRFFFDTILGVVAGSIILGILISEKVVSGSTDALTLAAVIVTNTIYESFLMCLMAYGLVQFPVSLWHKGSFEKSLELAQLQAAIDFRAISDANLEISLTVADVLKTRDSIRTSQQKELIEAVNVLLLECPSEFTSSRIGQIIVDKKTGKTTIDCLAQLRLRLNVNKNRYRMAQAKVEITKKAAYYVEDLIEARDERKAGGGRQVKWTTRSYDGGERAYLYHVWYRPIYYRCLAVAAAGLSLLSFLGVICSMHGVSTDVSPYFLAVHSTTRAADVTFFILFTMGYASTVTFWSLFQMSFAGSMDLIPHCTTPEALSFNARMVARLAAPLVFFYLGWIAENGLNTGSWVYNNSETDPVFMPSAFSNFYQLQSVYVIKHSFGTVFPIILIVMLFLFVTNLLNRLLIYLKLEKYQFGSTIVTEEQLRDGKRQLERQKKRAERSARKGGWLRGAGEEEGASSSLWQVLFGSTKYPGDAEASKPKKEVPRIVAPGVIFGTMERKEGKTGFLSLLDRYTEVYAEVRQPGCVMFFKDKAEAVSKRLVAPNSVESKDIIELRFAINFVVAEKEPVLSVVTTDGKVDLRFKTKTEAERWKARLIEWKDYSIDYLRLFPNGEPKVDVEAPVSVAAVGVSVGDDSGDEGEKATRPSAFRSLLQGYTGKSDDTAKKPLLNTSLYSNSLFSSGTQQQPPSQPPSGDLYKPKTADDNDLFNMSSISASGGGGEFGDKPDFLCGYLEKRSTTTSSFSGGKTTWERRFCFIDESTRSLSFCKSENDVQTVLGAIDLCLVSDILVDERSDGSKDYTQFTLDAGDKVVHKFRAADKDEGEQFVTGLQAWSDYFLFNLSSLH